MGAICPKNKTSKARRDSRRANWKMTAPNLVKCSKCGELMMPHRVCKACGSSTRRKLSQLSNLKKASKIKGFKKQRPLIFLSVTQK